jgi:hypothetical protein
MSEKAEKDLEQNQKQRKRNLRRNNKEYEAEKANR